MTMRLPHNYMEKHGYSNKTSPIISNYHDYIIARVWRLQTLNKLFPEMKEWKDYEPIIWGGLRDGDFH